MEWSKLLSDERIRPGRKGAGAGDLRTEYEKDYHRIIGSASFRRLQDKTQVFPLDKSDFIRTRLTHSLEVSSFGKSLGQNISQKILQEVKDPDFKPEYQGYICDILQCAGLLHDIGNPPFGHFGETVIREWFRAHMGSLRLQGRPLPELLTPQMQADFYEFEGNTQALRLVAKLHYLVDAHGMNLTQALLGTIIKYPVSSLEIDGKSGDIRTKKMGYFYAEQDLFAQIQQTLGTEGHRHPLAYVLEAADDIAYRTADVEDAFKKGCITYRQLVAELRACGQKLKAGKIYDQLVDALEERYGKGQDRGVSNPEAYAVQNWIVRIQAELLACATVQFAQNYWEIMEGNYRKELLTGEDRAKMADALGDIAYRYAFTSEPIYKLEIAAETIMDFLLEHFVDAAIVYDSGQPMTAVQTKLMTLVSDNYKAIYQYYSRDRNQKEKLYLRLLLVTDFICGMTDSYAKRLYQELSGIA